MFRKIILRKAFDKKGLIIAEVNNWPKNNYERKYSEVEVKLFEQIRALNKVGRVTL